MSYHPKIFVRSQNGIIAGVCQGLSEKLDIEPWLVRLVWLLTFFFMGTGLLFYVLCAIAFPREDRLSEALDAKLMGVCVRLSQRLDVEIGLIRLIALLLLLVSLGGTTIVYILLHFMLKDSSNQKSLF